MLHSKTVDKIIFLDIETTSQYPNFKSMPENFQGIFKKRFRNELKDLPALTSDIDKSARLEEVYTDKAPLYAEWNKIVCISIGWFLEKNITNEFIGYLSFKLRSFYGNDEKKLLLDFHGAMKSVLDCSFAHPNHLCAHAGKLFDFPVIAKRFILNGLPLPPALDYGHKKPWDIDYIVDTLDCWKYGAFDGGITLDMLAACFNIESSKVEMDGSMVKDVYWNEKDLAKIERYCKADVVVLGQVYLKMKNMHNKVNIL